MAQRLNRFLRSNRASAAVEFAIVAPLMLLLTGGTAEFGRIFQAYVAVNRLATQYAIAWSDCSDYPSGTCSSELSNYTNANAISNIVPQLQSARLTLSMFQVQMNGTTPTVTYAYPAGSTLTTAQASVARATFPSGQSGVIVTATYAHQLMYFSTLMSTYLGNHLNLSYTVPQLKS